MLSIENLRIILFMIESISGFILHNGDVYKTSHYGGEFI